PQPLIIMDEIVPYSNGPHEHFDLIYIGIAENMEFRSNDESSDCRWFKQDEIDSLETFDNVKKIIGKGFETFSRITGKA
ncbi:MAG: hypothetical protein M1123_04780, partial [Candidatus Thermoplasmatota archaeon]|nr:hypothetical protein [Candidatus Thermoplasmatota archaeon]